MQDKLETRSFLLMLLAVSVAFALILKPFWASIFWACAVAVIFYPLQIRLKRMLGRRSNRAALLTLLVATVIVVIPVLAVAYSFIQEGVQLYQRLSSGDVSIAQVVDKIEKGLPFLPDILARLGIDIESLPQRISDWAMSASQFFAQEALVVGQNTFGFVMNLGLMLYLTFFLLRDGNKLIRLMVRALPLGDEREHQLFKKFAEVTRATVKGNIVVAMVQGALGGIIFALLGIPAPVLWGVVMAFLSLIPAIGAGIVWLPVSVYLLATGAIFDGVVLVLYGVIIIGLADNVLRPLLVGRDTKLPDYIVLFSTLGGLSLFGITGFVIGPLIAALFLAFWDMFTNEFNVGS
ncbi:putative PurR-regulated permease PerM [Idiomarina fontislapidosi]|uniref:AI-2E family transporter n=1 Tax=Idiomarina fontislapidosi TaxID=263723 RepID=A0A432Y8F2_9GAMM|nr:AI-2E family transporter [Idiomarina fontislapidosi]PYE33831.1 putative PurR-regulated permease PerM [Idiomarina fontislapidosi]RUO57223.1 AI-2E family transporter [Idiomarina fontislapidosi]|tara:strand:+ start:2927 stop:3973 length:1047 start_codon:yes stop_codon:yes gene_type:complete